MDQKRLGEIVETMHLATGIGIRCRRIHDLEILASAGFSEEEDLERVHVEEVREYIKRKDSSLKTEGLTADNTFYTFYTSDDVLFLIHFFSHNGERLVMIAGPLILKEAGIVLDQMVLARNCSVKESILLKHLIESLPRVNFQQVYSLGRLLVLLTRQEQWDQKIIQVTEGTPQHQEEEWDRIPAVSFTKVRAEKHVPYEFTMALIDRIRAGDLPGVKTLLGELDKMPWDQLVSHDLIRSMKNNCISACSSFGFLAINENAPYIQMLEMADEFIDQIEKTNSVKDLMELMKTMAIAFTKVIISFSEKQYSKPVRDAIQYIREHLQQPISLEELSNRVKLSPTYLSRLINRETSQSLSRLINQVRIEESKYLLRKSDSSLQEIAVAVGFSYQNHFSATFKQYVGMTPSEYRRSQ